MTFANSQNGWVIVIMLIFGLILSIVPMPIWARDIRPQWVSLILIYWCLALPHRVNIGSAWILGIIQDVLLGTLLGQHALGLSVVAFFAVELHLRIRIFPLWQQSVTVMVLLLLERLLELWVMGATGQPPPDLWYWLPAITSALLWSWIYILLRDIRRRFNVT